MRIRRSVIKKIEDIFNEMVNALDNNEAKQLSIVMRVRKSATNAELQAPTDNEAIPPEPRTRRLCFPGKSEEEAWRFSMRLAYASQTV